MLVALEQLDYWRLAHPSKPVHICVVWHTQNLSLFQKLESFTVAGEERSPRKQLEQNAAR